MNIDRTNIHKLAREFGSAMQEVLSRAEFNQMIDRNKAEESIDICHSHDFCDANVVMETAFIRVMGREPDFEPDDDDIQLWTLAWDMAKAADFFA